MNKLKYKIGDRVRIKSLDWYNENKDKYGSIYAGSGFCFWKNMVRHCGEIMKITSVKVDPEDSNKGFYFMENSDEKWTDGMIEGLVEEEKKPEFKVGDKITNGKTQLTILQITSDKYIVDDSFGECGILYFNTQDDWKLVEEECKPKFKVGDKVKDKNNRVWFIVQVGKTFFDISRVPKGSDGAELSGYFVPMEDQDDYELVPQCFSNEIEINNMKRNACQKCAFAVYDDNPHCGLRGFTNDFNVEYCSAEDDTIPNGYELQEDGYFSWVKKKKEYPKTFRECQECLGEDVPPMEEPDSKTHRRRQVHLLEVLLICRDAYWKIAGEEMGLGKPWEPDWTDDNAKYSIYTIKGALTKAISCYDGAILTFPTEEMRDAFYENFKELIEQCKELL